MAAQTEQDPGAAAPDDRALRVLALDLGRRRIGLAISDPLGLTAQGLPTLQRQNRRADMEALRRIVEEHQASLIVLGNPKHLSGREGKQSEGASAFAENLRRHTGREVVLWDERLTTAEAQRVLRASGVSIEKRNAAVDRMAAVILLQSYLDSQRMQSAREAEDSTPSS